MQEPSGTTASHLLCVQHIKTIDPFFFFTVELYGMIAYAAQGNRNGHEELQYQSNKSISLSQTIVDNMCSRGKYNIQKLIICS